MRRITILYKRITISRKTGKFYPIRFIGNDDMPHSEVTHYYLKEVASLEVEHPMSCELESRAKSFLSEYKYRSIELPPELYFTFCSEEL